MSQDSASGAAGATAAPLTAAIDGTSSCRRDSQVE
jgi:hypothetical protein